MSTMIAEAPPRETQTIDKEVLWNDFLHDLESWELHKLLIVGELELHDAFIDGTKKLMDIFGLVQDSCKCRSCRNLKNNEDQSVKVEEEEE